MNNSATPIDAESDERAFNETLKRMLKTPPTPHDKKPPTTNQREAPLASEKRDVDNGNNCVAGS